MKSSIYFCLIFVVLLCSCTKDDEVQSKTPQPSVIPEEYLEQGIIRIKLKPEVADNINFQITRNGEVSTGINSLDELASQLGASRIERTFHHGGKYEKRQRKAGLHLWYDVYFDKDIPATRAANDFGQIEAIDISEVSPIITCAPYTSKPLSKEEIQSLIQSRADEIPPHPSGFSDPLIWAQWHYYNDAYNMGTISRAAYGADINAVNAWKTETGKPEVIVCIVDGGIDYNHEDLKDNMWINQAEVSGAEGADDDGNGYIDDIYGWNFIDNSPVITSNQHGTHVAGTVGAVSNNGIGLAGVAGGDGTPGSGVRLMSAQIFSAEGIGGDSSASKNAILYGANNGAVICQNSWGYRWLGTEHPGIVDSDKEAIDYFIKYAGTDEEGEVQVGPMKGGIVIFAAGNNSTHLIQMPQAYDAVMAVASMGANYYRASYSSYGSWVDITAPGGNQSDDAGMVNGHGVASTAPGNEYVYLQGTSMACPHVSGIAALVVSQQGVGKPGFTPDKLRKILESSVHDINIHNKDYMGLMGSGYIDAYMAVAENNGSAPQKVSDIKTEWTLNKTTINWSITEDDDTGVAFSYKVILCEGNVSGIDPANLPAGALETTMLVGNGQVGDPLQTKFFQLKEGTEYTIGIVGYDLWGNASEVAIANGVTVRDNEPELIKTFDNIHMKAIGESISLPLTEYFKDDFDETLIYEVNVSSKEVIKVDRNTMGVLKLIARDFGSAEVTVSALDSKKQKVTASFKVAIQNGDQRIELYPNPVKTTLNIRVSPEVSGTAKVTFYNTSGVSILRANVELDAYNAASVDAKDIPAGVYTVIVETNDGKEFKKTIAKI